MPIEYCFSRLNPTIVERYPTREEAFARARQCVAGGYAGTMTIVMRSTVWSDNIFEVLWVGNRFEEEEDIEPTAEAIYDYAVDLLEEDGGRGGRQGE